MSVRDRLTTRRPRPARKHRAIDEVDRLKFLLAGANGVIRALRVQLDDQAAEHEETVARIDARHAETVRGLERQLTEAHRRLDIGVKAEHVIAPTQEIPAEQVLTLWQARDAGRLGPVTDPGRIGTH